MYTLKHSGFAWKCNPLVTDKWSSPSIKDNQRKNSESNSQNHEIKGHEEADSRMYYHVAFLTSQHTGSTTKGAILSSVQEQMMLTVSLFPLTA